MGNHTQLDTSAPAQTHQRWSPTLMIAFDRNDTQQHDFLRRVTRRYLTPPVT